MVTLGGSPAAMLRRSVCRASPQMSARVLSSPLSVFSRKALGGAQLPLPRPACRRRGVVQQVRAVAAGPPADSPPPGADTAPAPAPAPSPFTDALPSPLVYQKMVENGVMKAGLPLWKGAMLGILAGFYIGFGAMLMLNVGINCPGLATTNPGLQKLVMGAVGLPFGLLMVIICGAELFTGNTMMMACALYEGKVSLGDVLRVWTSSFITNLVGSVGLVAVIVAAGIAPPLAATVGVAVKKSTLPFLQAFLRGILANWLVNVAVWQATSSNSIVGKIAGGIIPILTFVGIGLEHSVANMFFIPMAMALGAPITVRQFLLDNLLPVTLGNIIGGAVCVAGVYALAYGRPGGATAT